MRCLLIIAAVAALATARPDLYRENEDFQYSRKSTDEGSKSGFYEAQRGNVGGNYERAHNMDHLAQHHMSGLVSQVDGEIGDGKDAPLGHLYASGSSHGVYGSGQYDLGNLEGRNFAEGESFGSGSHSSLSSAHNAGYGSRSSGYTSNSHSQKYHSSGSSGLGSQALVIGQLQTVGTNGGYEYGKESSEHTHKEYHSGSSLTGGRPSKIILRPATFHVPVSAQVIDASQSSSYDQNSINSQTELLENTGVVASYRPAAHDKGWESSSQYRKEWEKWHQSQPSSSVVVLPSVVVPTPYQQNHELYEDHQSNNYHSSSSQIANSGSSGAYHSGIYGGQLVEAATPKSHQSSYSYHKSWERQGEPYVIEPVSGQLNTGSFSSSQHHGSQSHQSFTQGSKPCVTLCY